MKRIRRIACFLLTAILLANSFVLNVIAATEIVDHEAVFFELNHSSHFAQSLEIRNNKITIHGLPATDAYKYVWFSLEDGNGDAHFKSIVARNSLSNAEFTLPANLCGIFEIVAYQSAERYSTYHAFLYNLYAEIENGRIQIIESPAYAGNLALAQKERVDDDALAFYLTSSANIQSDDFGIMSLAQQITEEVGDDYNKALAIHDWVCDNISYDRDVLYKRVERGDTSAIGVLSTRRSVCEGYANLTAALLRAAGIPAKKVSGYALGSTAADTFPADALDRTGDTNHAWNEAFVGGRWIILDTTWDSDNAYEYGEVVSGGGCYQHRYFDISREFFAQTHAVMKSQNYSEMYLYLDYPDILTAGGWKRLGKDGVTPVMRGGRTLAPIRAIIEEMGGKVEYTPETERYLARITCQTDDYFAQMWIGSDRLVINGKEYKFDVKPQVINGHTMVPISTLLNAMGCDIKWDREADDWHGRVTIGYTS